MVFRMANGDFAEWRRRDPLAREFEEGDIIGVDSAGLLTLQTVGMKQVGVISRRAAVEGSCPAADEQHLFDLVAYSGHVPVKLRGHCRPGDIIIPSGLADGTAMSQDSPHSRCVAFKKTQKLGRALAGTSTSEPEDLELLPLPAESADNDAWSLVLISVINPVDTVSRPIRSAVTTILAGVFGILVCWALIASLVHTDSDHNLKPPPTPPDKDQAEHDGIRDGGIRNTSDTGVHFDKPVAQADGSFHCSVATDLLALNFPDSKHMACLPRFGCTVCFGHNCWPRLTTVDGNITSQGGCPTPTGGQSSSTQGMHVKVRSCAHAQKVCVSTCALGGDEKCPGTSVCVAAPTLLVYGAQHSSVLLRWLPVRCNRNWKKRWNQTKQAHFIGFCGVCAYPKPNI